MLFYILLRLGGIQCLACSFISYHVLEVSAKAWHAPLYLITSWQYPPLARHSILYLITPWQYPQRLGMHFYILSRLAVSAKAWHALLYLITPLQYPPLARHGALFYILSRLGSIR